MRHILQEAWEAGGNLNFAIAASRLGLECSSFGHVARDPFGLFLERVLGEEGVQLMRLEDEEESAGESASSGSGESSPDSSNGSAPQYCGETLACWVFLDPSGRHAFARYSSNQIAECGSASTSCCSYNPCTVWQRRMVVSRLPSVYLLTVVA